MFYEIKKKDLFGLAGKLLVLFLLLTAYSLRLTTLYAGDIDAELNTFDGSTSFDIKDSDKITVSSITSNGDYYGNLLRLNGTGDNYFLGKVGIGAPNPQSKLDILSLSSGDGKEEMARFSQSGDPAAVLKIMNMAGISGVSILGLRGEQNAGTANSICLIISAMNLW